MYFSTKSRRFSLGLLAEYHWIVKTILFVAAILSHPITSPANNLDLLRNKSILSPLVCVRFRGISNQWQAKTGFWVISHNADCQVLFPSVNRLLSLLTYLLKNPYIVLFSGFRGLGSNFAHLDSETIKKGWSCFASRFHAERGNERGLHFSSNTDIGQR